LSLLSYGLIVSGVMLGGVGLLVIFSLLAAAQQGDEYLEQMEFILSQRQTCPLSRPKEGKPHNTCIPAHPHLKLVEASQTRTLRP
jgi:hypothetical protein